MRGRSLLKVRGLFGELSKSFNCICTNRAGIQSKETVAKRGHITAADLDREAGKVREGDIVIIDSSYKLYPFTPDTNTDKDQRLLVGAESAEWFKAHKVKAVGFGDGVSIENCNEDVKPFNCICTNRAGIQSKDWKWGIAHEEYILLKLL